MGFVYRLDFANGKTYVGITTKSLKHRFYHHKYSVERGDTRNRLVYNAWRKHGDPTISVIEEVPDADLPAAEIRIIAQMGTLAPGGYNSTAGGEATLGHKHSPESRLKMSLAHMGQSRPRTTPSPLIGTTISDEQRAKISASLKGVAWAPGRLERVVAGRKAAEERRKASGADHHRKGTKHPPETRALMGKGRLGKALDPEHRAALSAGAKAYWAAKRLAKADAKAALRLEEAGLRVGLQGSD